VVVVAPTAVVGDSLIVGALVSLPVVAVDPAEPVDAPSTVSPGASGPQLEESSSKNTGDQGL
jgi:hypothetical protein